MGFVIDGVVRDIGEIRERRFPLFARGVFPKPGNKTNDGASQIEITCGSVKVNTGDFIVADEEGIVVIPQNDIKNVLDSALQKKTRAEAQPLDEWRKNHYKKNRSASGSCRIIAMTEPLKILSKPASAPTTSGCGCSKHAEQSVQNLPVTLFKDTQRIKADLYTWLAWQERPGYTLDVTVRGDLLDVATEPLALVSSSGTPLGTRSSQLKQPRYKPRNACAVARCCHQCQESACAIRPYRHLSDA